MSSPLPSAANSKASHIRANFENLAKEREQGGRRKAEAERAQRTAKGQQGQQAAHGQLDVSGPSPSLRRGGKHPDPRLGLCSWDPCLQPAARPCLHRAAAVLPVLGCVQRVHSSPRSAITLRGGLGIQESPQEERRCPRRLGLPPIRVALGLFSHARRREPEG